MKRIRQISLSIVMMGTLTATLGACGKSTPEPSSDAEDTAYGSLVTAPERARIETDQAMETSRQRLEDALKAQEEGRER